MKFLSFLLFIHKHKYIGKSPIIVVFGDRYVGEKNEKEKGLIERTKMIIQKKRERREKEKDH